MTREIPQIKPSDTHRRSVRSLLRSNRSGSLATISPQPGAGDQGGPGAAGTPYVSLVTHATLPDASPIFLLSELAEHTQNLRKIPHAAFLVEQASALPNPQTGPRATVTGTLRRITPTEDASVRARFLARHPTAARYADFADFSFWVMEIERIHFVGGFARAVWIDDGLGLPPELCRTLDTLGPALCEEMNRDAAAAIARLAAGNRSDGDAPPSPDDSTGPWRITALDADGVEIGTATEARRIPFPAPLRSPDDLRPALTALLRGAPLPPPQAGS